MSRRRVTYRRGRRGYPLGRALNRAVVVLLILLAAAVWFGRGSPADPISTILRWLNSNRVPSSAVALPTLVAQLRPTVVLPASGPLGEPPTAVPPARPAARPQAPAAPGALPELAVKPQPVAIAFDGCPAEGDGGDPLLNKLKNRGDDGSYQPVGFGAVAQLSWPKSVERRDRDKWSASDAAAVARYEGTPITVEGYLVGARESEPESCNCNREGPEFRDWHVWLAESPAASRAQAIITETTPRVRAKHPAWRLDVLQRVSNTQQRVRISGWLMFDPEHPDQVGQTRVTLWEIHPIMRIEVDQNGSWISLDNP